jgi:hypothetical protein
VPLKWHAALGGKKSIARRFCGESRKPHFMRLN